MDIWQRRELLNPIANPDRSVDSVTTLTGSLTATGAGGEVAVMLRYVPDAQILTPGTFAAYLRALEGETWTSQEHLATTLLQDVNNAVVPRWVQVTARTGKVTAHHQVMVEDRQPGWNNPSLLAQLGPV